jgi:hypothetical protein
MIRGPSSPMQRNLLIGRCLGVSGPTLTPRIDVEALHLKHLASCVRSGESACRDVYFEAGTFASSANVGRSVVTFGLGSFGNIGIAPPALHLFWYLRLRRRDDASKRQSSDGVDEEGRSHRLTRGRLAIRTRAKRRPPRKRLRQAAARIKAKRQAMARSLAFCHLTGSTAAFP